MTDTAGEYSPTLRRIVWEEDRKEIMLLLLSMTRVLTDLRAMRSMGISTDSGSSTREEEQSRSRPTYCLELPAPLPASTMQVASTAISLMYTSSSSIMSGVKRVPTDRATFMFAATRAGDGGGSRKSKRNVRKGDGSSGGRNAVCLMQVTRVCNSC